MTLSVAGKSIYRYMDLYELYELVANNKLKFTKLRLMDDKNEGLGEILKLQSSTWGFPLRNSNERIKQEYDSHRENVYVSCWTTVANSMAMWLLYSKNNSSFRVKTTEKKLRCVLETDSENVLSKHTALTLNTFVPIMHELNPVEYVNFHTIHQQLREKLNAFDREIMEAYKEGRPDDKRLNMIFQNHDARAAELFKNSGTLKDEAYRHENELRASFHLRIRNEMTIDEYRNAPHTIKNVLSFPMLELCTRKDSPSVFHLDTSDDFVEEICCDSRMPKHLYSTILQMLGRSDITFVTTDVFGCIVDEHDLTIPEP